MGNEFEYIRTKATYLHVAASRLNSRAIETLAEHGSISEPDCQGQTPLHWLLAANQDYFSKESAKPAGDSCIQEGGEKTLLKVVEAATALLQIPSTDVNMQDNFGRTALHYAAILKAHDVMRLLFAFGARSCIKDSQGSTVLHAFAQAALQGEPWCTRQGFEPTYSREFVTLLTKHCQAEIDTVDSTGATALSIACRAYSISRVQVMLAMGANPNIRDNRSWTALHHTMRRPEHLRRVPGEHEFGPVTTWSVSLTVMEKIKTLLVAAGADESARNDQSKTAADIAREEAEAAEVDRTDMIRDMEELHRRKQWIDGENETRRIVWLARVRDEAARAHGARQAAQISDGIINDLTRGLGRGHGCLRPYPTSIMPFHRTVIAAALDPNHPRFPDGRINMHDPPRFREQ